MTERIVPKAKQRITDTDSYPSGTGANENAKDSQLQETSSNGAQTDDQQGNSPESNPVNAEDKSQTSTQKTAQNAESIDSKIERAKAYSQAKAEEHGDEPTLESLADKVDGKTTQHHKKSKGAAMGKWIFGLGSLVLVLAMLWYTRPDTDWQIQRINDLQTQVDQLATKLTEQQQQIEGVNQQVNSAENKPVLSQADLEAFKTKTQQQLQSLQQSLQQLSEQAGSGVDATAKQLSDLAQQLPERVTPSPETQQKLQQLEQKLSAELQTMADKFGELFDFKQQTEQAVEKPAKAESTDLKIQPLDSLQIQQWIVEINTQWILQGRSELTSQQLLALEQAVNLSQFGYSAQLTRLIGEDLRYLQDYKAKSVVDMEAPIQALYQRIAELKKDSAENTVSDSAESSADAPAGSSFDALLDKFSQMISLRKRTDENALTPVESLIMNDVLKQRLALLVERLQWAVQSQSPAQTEQSIAAIEAFVAQYYDEASADFETLLEPFKQIEFVSREALAIMNLGQAK